MRALSRVDQGGNKSMAETVEVWTTIRVHQIGNRSMAESVEV